MLKRSLTTATLGAGLLALAMGGAFAQSSTTTSPSTGSTPPSASPSTTDKSGASGSSSESTSPSGSSAQSSSPSGSSSSGMAAGKPAAPSEALVGKEIVNAKGDKIGEVEAIEGDKVIVSVGGFLGMGDRKVALDWEKLNMQGTGEDAKLQTAMTKKELEALPEYTASKSGGSSGSSSGSSSSPSSSPSTGGSSGMGGSSGSSGTGGSGGSMGGSGGAR